jgi:hypothetical protein
MATDPQGVEVALASRRSRTWFLAIVLLWLIFLFILAAVVLPELRQIGHVPIGREWLYRTVVLVILGFPIFLFAYNAALAAGAIKHGRFPPPNYPLLGNTRVIVGQRAKRKAWGVFLSALIGAIAASVLLLALIR